MNRYFWALLRDPNVIFKWRHNLWKLMICKQISIVAKGEEAVQWGDRSLQPEAGTPPECWRHHRGKRGKRSFRFTTPDPSAQNQWRALPVQKVYLLKSALTSSSSVTMYKISTIKQWNHLTYKIHWVPLITNNNIQTVRALTELCNIHGNDSAWWGLLINADWSAWPETTELTNRKI